MKVLVPTLLAGFALSLATFPALAGEAGRATRQFADTRGKFAVRDGVDDKDDRDDRDGERDRLYRRGIDLLLGLTGEIDHVAAFKDFRQAAEKGHPVARAQVAYMIVYGTGTARDGTKGLKLLEAALPGLERAADAGDPFALYRRGWMAFNGVAVSQDKKAAARWMLEAADKDNAAALNDVGWMYANGHGVAKDDREATGYYRKAAKKGLGLGMHNLGVRYANGRGIEKNLKEAAHWYQQAAERGHSGAMVDLGFAYERALGVERDDYEALKWYRKAAAKGHSTGVNNVGVMYALGRGVEKDDKEACEWFQRAARKGNALAMRNLGLSYANGKGVEKDDKKAFEWYQRAAVRGNTLAMYNLGFMYLNGRGTDKDEKEAYDWYKMAAARGDANARTALATLEKKKRETGLQGRDYRDPPRKGEKGSDVVPDRKALVIARVAPNATIRIDGQKMRSAGMERRYVTPLLETNERYYWTFVVTWVEDGKERSVERVVRFRPGDKIQIDLTENDVF